MGVRRLRRLRLERRRRVSTDDVQDVPRDRDRAEAQRRSLIAMRAGLVEALDLIDELEGMGMVTLTPKGLADVTRLRELSRPPARNRSR